MRVCCTCGRYAILNRPGKRKNCRHCGRDLRDAKPAKPRAVSIKTTTKKAKAPNPPVDPDPPVDPEPEGGEARDPKETEDPTTEGGAEE